MYQTIENNYSEGIFVQLHLKYVKQKSSCLQKYIFVNSQSLITPTIYPFHMYIRYILEVHKKDVHKYHGKRQK